MKNREIWVNEKDRILRFCGYGDSVQLEIPISHGFFCDIL